MKKACCAIALAALLFALCACAGTWVGHDGLIQKAREEIPLAEIGQTEIAIAGSVDSGGRSLVWFVTGGGHQAHGYFPLEFEASDRAPDRFRFVKAYKAYERGTDIAALPWNGYVFLVNNPDCRKIVLDFGDGRTEEIAIDSGFLPAIHHTENTPERYIFVDEGGNEIR